MTQDVVIKEQEGHVLTLTMNRPKQRNAFNSAMWGAMRDGLRDARADDSVRCVVVTGAEGAFSAGQDLGDAFIRIQQIKGKGSEEMTFFLWVKNVCGAGI